MDFVKPDIDVNFVSKRRIAMIVSLIAIAIGVFSLVVKGGPRYGIDFAGGTLIQVRFTKAPDVGQIRDVLAEKGLGSAVIQSQGEEKVAVRIQSDEEQAETISEDVFNILEKYLKILSLIQNFQTPLLLFCGKTWKSYMIWQQTKVYLSQQLVRVLMS